MKGFINKSMLCACGCGSKVTSIESRCVKGHHNKLPKYRKELSTKQKGRNNSYWKGGKLEFFCTWCEKKFLVYPYTNKYGKFCSRQCYGKFNKVEEISKTFMLKFMNLPGTNKRVSDTMKLLWKDPEYRDKLCASLSGKPGPIFSKEVIIRIKAKCSAAMKRLWQDPEYIKKQMKARGCKPNKKEKLLVEILDELLPDEYKFVGDGEFILAGKCPDFLNVNGQKKIIELFGTYWHKPKEEQFRIDLFSQYGYQTLIIWENELNNPNKLEEKLTVFHNE